MSHNGKPQRPTNTAQGRAEDRQSKLEVVELELTLTGILKRIQDARSIAQELISVDEELKRMRERIVVWCSKYANFGDGLSDPLAQECANVLIDTANQLKRLYYTVGEKFTPIDVEKEIENVIPF